MDPSQWIPLLGFVLTAGVLIWQSSRGFSKLEAGQAHMEKRLDNLDARFNDRLASLEADVVDVRIDVGKLMGPDPRLKVES